MKLCKPLTARRPDLGPGFIMIGRVSTPGQDLANIDASFVNLRRIVADNCAADTDVAPRIVELGEQASGMRATRKTIEQAKALIATGEWDAVFAEDMGRIFRNPQSLFEFLFFCVDMGVRVVCPNDGVDTAAPEFLVLLHCGALRHGLMVEETRKRVRRTATKNFEDGGMVTKHKFAYQRVSREQAAAASGPVKLLIARREEFATVVREMCDRVLRGEAYTSIARWLNDAGVPPGPYVTSGRWRDATVKSFLRSPILHGEKTFRDVVHIPSMAGGKTRVVRDPEQTLRSFHSELAFLTAEEHARVLETMDERGRRWARRGGPDSPMAGRPRSQSPWPGQAVRCGVCCGPLYREGKVLKCPRANETPARCWNRGLTSIARLNGMTIDFLMPIIESAPLFRRALADVVWREQQRCGRSRGSALTVLDAKIEALATKEANFVDAVGRGKGKIDALVAALAETQTELAGLRAERRQVVENDDCGEYKSREEIERQIGRVLREGLDDSLDLADLLRRVVVGFTIFPVRGMANAQVRPRALIEIDLGELGGDASRRFSTSIDAFQAPQYVRLFDQLEALRAATPNIGSLAIARALGVNHMAAKRALAYADAYRRSGRTAHYEPVTERPTDASRWRSARRSPAEPPPKGGETGCNANL